MATDTASSREIERRLEDERAQLRDTIDELWNRMTFEDAWNRIGTYLRDNRSHETLGRLAREKPIAVALTAIGVAWLLFGPSSNPPRRTRALPSPDDRYAEEMGGARVARTEAAHRADTETPRPGAAIHGAASIAAGPAVGTTTGREDRATASSSGVSGTAGSGVGSSATGTRSSDPIGAASRTDTPAGSPTGAANSSPRTSAPTTATPGPTSASTTPASRPAADGGSAGEASSDATAGSGEGDERAGEARPVSSSSTTTRT